MRGDKGFEFAFPIGAINRLPDDAVRIGAACKLAIGVEHECHAAGHTRAKIAARCAQDNRNPAGHIFQTVGATSLNHDMRA